MAQNPTLAGIAPPKDGVDALRQEIQALRLAVRELQTARSGNATVISGQPGITVQDGGGIRIADGGSLEMDTTTGVPVLYAGTRALSDGSGRMQQVFAIGRDDGSLALALGDFGTTPGHPHQQDLFWYDRSSNTIFADDAVSGVGIAVPHLNMPTLVNTNVATWPGTTNTAFTGISGAFVERQNAQLSWTIAIAAGSGVAGQFRLMCNGTQIGTTQTVTNSVTYWSDDAPWPSTVPIFTDVYLELQGRLSSGSGTVSAQSFRLRGNQS